MTAWKLRIFTISFQFNSKFKLPHRPPRQASYCTCRPFNFRVLACFWFGATSTEPIGLTLGTFQFGEDRARTGVVLDTYSLYLVRYARLERSHLLWMPLTLRYRCSLKRLFLHAAHICIMIIEDVPACPCLFKTDTNCRPYGAYSCVRSEAFWFNTRNNFFSNVYVT